MNRTDRLLVGVGVGTVVLLVAATLVVPPGRYDSTTELLLRTLHRRLLVVAIPIAVLVEAVLVWTVWRFHGAESPTPTPENRRVEIGWTLVTALVLLFVGTASFQVMAAPEVTAFGPSDGEPAAVADGGTPGEPLEIEITGSQWAWQVTYPAANVTIRDAETIFLPVDRPIAISVTSSDVIHSIHAPGLGLKLDAIPGQTNRARTRLTTTGTHRLYCAEYCGSGHSRMRATIRVVSGNDFEAWLAERADRTGENASR